MPTLTDAIRDAIRASDQTPYGIAKGAGVARSQLSRLLSGQSGLTVETLERIAAYLGMRIRLEPTGQARRKAGRERRDSGASKSVNKRDSR
jgi:transcriptional regulator with XRE-family HTH domain